MVCSRDPRVSTYATASVLAAAYAHGGGENNVQPGLDFFKQLRDSGNLRQGVVLNVAAVQKGEAPISWSTISTASPSGTPPACR